MRPSDDLDDNIKIIFLSYNDNIYYWYCKKNVSLSQESEEILDIYFFKSRK